MAKEIGIVRGSAAQAVPLVVGNTVVYVHTDIKQATDENGDPVDNMYEYYETQYGKNEYIQLISEKNTSLESQLTETQMALAEIYEMIQQ